MSLKDRITSLAQAIGSDMGDLQNRWGSGAALVSGSNIDNIDKNGSYLITTAVITGSPALAGLSAESGSNLIQFQFNSANATQLLSVHPSATLYFRVKDNSAWGAFKKLYDDDENYVSLDSDGNIQVTGALVRVNGAGDTGSRKERYARLDSIAFYNNDSYTATGSLCITLAGEGASTFFNGEILITRNFQDSVRVKFNGYYSSFNVWTDTSVECDDPAFVRYVRFGKDALNNPVIFLSDREAHTSSTWDAYIQVELETITAGWTGAAGANVRNPENYSINLLTDETGYTIEHTLDAKPRGSNILRRRYVDFADYAPANDALECHTALEAFYAAGEGREMVFTNPIGSQRTYRFLDRALGTVIGPKAGRLIWADGAKFEVNWNTASTTGEEFQRSVGSWHATTSAINSNLSIGDRTISVPTGHGSLFSQGMLCYLKSNQNFTEEEGVIGKKGEFVWVAEVNGDNLTLISGLKDFYTSSGFAIQLYRENELCQLHFDNPQLYGPGQFDGAHAGDRGIQVGNSKYCHITGGEVSGFDRVNITIITCAQGSIKHTTASLWEKGNNTATSYNFVLANAIENFDVYECYSNGGREGFCLSATGDLWGLNGVSRNVSYRGCEARGARRSGFATHDIHDDIEYSFNRVDSCEQGFDCRILNARYTHNKISNTGTYNGSLDCAFQLGSGSGELTFDGNEYLNVLRGVWMPDAIEHESVPGDITIRNEKGRNIGAHGILLDYRGSPKTGYAKDNDILGQLTIEGINYTMGSTGAPRAVETQGRWTDPLVKGTVRGGGTATACVYMHGSGVGGSGNGPINADIQMRYPSGFNNPLIQHATGTTKINGRGIGHMALGE